MTMRADIGPGVAFPDYELPDHTGRLRRLSEMQGDDPMVIVLAREAYSAKDQVQHEGLVQLWREMKPGVGYCRMVTITTADPQEALNYRNGVGAEWPFLADPGRIVQRDQRKRAVARASLLSVGCYGRGVDGSGCAGRTLGCLGRNTKVSPLSARRGRSASSRGLDTCHRWDFAWDFARPPGA